MARKAKDITDAELAIMQVLWESEPCTVRQLTEELYDKSGSSQNATVQKLLDRLEQKVCVERDRSTWPHTYTSSVDRSDIISRQLQDTADKLCDGSLAPLLTHLVKGEGLSSKDRKSLRGLLDELDGKRKKK
jgi:predicted transcriptional regulator